MTFAEIKHEIDTLSVEEQDRLSAYLALLQHERDPDWVERLDKKLNDRNPENWVSLEDLESDNR